MSVLSDFGVFLQSIAHDYKNQLGILETILKDAKDGYEIDEESFQDSFLALRNFAYLSHVLQLGGMIYENTRYDRDGELLEVDKVLNHVLKLLSKLFSGNSSLDDQSEQKKPYQLVLIDPASNKKTFINESLSIDYTKQVIENVFPAPKPGTTSSQRATYHLIKLLQENTSLKSWIFMVNEIDDSNKNIVNLKIECLKIS